MSVEACIDLVRRFDYERYVTVLFSPRKGRTSLWVLYALHCEIARIEQIVKDPMMRLVRLQWWHDAISRLYAGQVERHEVLEALAEQLKKGEKWQEQQLHDMIEGYVPQPDETMAQQLEQRSLPLLHLVCPDIPQDVLKKIGAAYELVLLLKRQEIPQQDIHSAIDIALKDLSAIDRLFVKRNKPLLIYFSVLRDLRLIKKHNYNVRQALQNQNPFMLPLYLLLQSFK